MSSDNTKETKLPSWKETAKSRPTMRIEFPYWDADGKPVEYCTLRIISQDERIQASTKAMEETAKRLKKVDMEKGTEAYKDLYTIIFTNVAGKHQLYYAVRKSDNVNDTFFDVPEDLGKLTETQTDYIFKRYNELCEGHPYMTDESPEAIESYINKMVEEVERSPDFLARGSQVVQGLLLTSLVNQLSTLKKTNLSPGSLPNEFTSTGKQAE